MVYQSQDQVHVSEAAMIALHDLSAHELSTAYRTRRLSPVEVTRAVLSRIDAWEKRINAMYVIDAAGALAMAAASQERWRRRKPLSPLDGVPITIKDNIAVKGIPAPFGTAAGDMTPSAFDAPPTARVREAGCVLLGKTTMPDFGMLSSGLSSAATRSPVLPDIPTVVEFVPGHEFSFWTGIGAPKTRPPRSSTSSTPRSMRLSPIPR
jgi:Asp-tRNA(Asn)/Glu-tRNA(Gln) amidotransferase A subunit family amidase